MLPQSFRSALSANPESRDSGFDAFASPRNDWNSIHRVHRGCNQLDGVVAVPFRWSGNGGDLAALAVDQHRGRHPQRSSYRFKVLKNLGFLVAKIAEPGQ